MQKKERIPGAIHERNYIYDFHFHLIWVTKYRNPAFTTQNLADDMKAILTRLAEEKGISIEEMEVMPDHIHLLISFKPKYAPADIVKYLKGHSAKQFFMMHPEIRDQKFWGGHLWSHSYFMSTLGDMSREVVEKYIRNQYSK